MSVKGSKNGTFFDYEGFVEKFEPKKTTDDCCTPPDVYDAIKDWVCARYDVDESRIVRPFWPDGDYELFDYPDGCVVLDNPPFSILGKIINFYLRHGVDFFLFAPGLTAFNYLNTEERRRRLCVYAIDTNIIYDNGANVRTGFVTTLEKNFCAWSCPELREIVKQVQDSRIKSQKKNLPKYEYPPEVCTAAMLMKYSCRGIDFRIPADECAPIDYLQSQKKMKKTIFGNGLLLSARLASERAAAERLQQRLAAETRIYWPLSAEERETVRRLSGGEYMPACGMENIAEIPGDDSDELQGGLFDFSGGEEA